MPRSAPLKTVRGQLRRAVSEAREAGRISTALEVQVLIADRLAGELDSAKGSEFVKAVAEFQRAVSLLPLEEPRVSAGDGGTDERGRVLELLDRPAAVGDSSYAG